MCGCCSVHDLMFIFMTPFCLLCRLQAQNTAMRSELRDLLRICDAMLDKDAHSVDSTGTHGAPAALRTVSKSQSHERVQRPGRAREVAERHVQQHAGLIGSDSDSDSDAEVAVPVHSSHQAMQPLHTSVHAAPPPASKPSPYPAAPHPSTLRMPSTPVSAAMGHTSHSYGAAASAGMPPPTSMQDGHNTAMAHAPHPEAIRQAAAPAYSSEYKSGYDADYGYSYYASPAVADALARAEQMALGAAAGMDQGPDQGMYADGGVGMEASLSAPQQQAQVCGTHADPPHAARELDFSFGAAAAQPAAATPALAALTGSAADSADSAAAADVARVVTAESQAAGDGVQQLKDVDSGSEFSGATHAYSMAPSTQARGQASGQASSTSSESHDSDAPAASSQLLHRLQVSGTPHVPGSAPAAAPYFAAPSSPPSAVHGVPNSSTQEPGPASASAQSETNSASAPGTPAATLPSLLVSQVACLHEANRLLGSVLGVYQGVTHSFTHAAGAVAAGADPWVGLSPPGNSSVAFLTAWQPGLMPPALVSHTQSTPSSPYAPMPAPAYASQYGFNPPAAPAAAYIAHAGPAARYASSGAAGSNPSHFYSPQPTPAQKHAYASASGSAHSQPHAQLDAGALAHMDAQLSADLARIRTQLAGVKRDTLRDRLTSLSDASPLPRAAALAAESRRYDEAAAAAYHGATNSQHHHMGAEPHSAYNTAFTGHAVPYTTAWSRPATASAPPSHSHSQSHSDGPSSTALDRISAELRALRHALAADRQGWSAALHEGQAARREMMAMAYAQGRTSSRPPM